MTEFFLQKTKLIARGCKNILKESIGIRIKEDNNVAKACYQSLQLNILQDAFYF
jgi:hypothetical protein